MCSRYILESGGNCRDCGENTVCWKLVAECDCSVRRHWVELRYSVPKSYKTMQVFANCSGTVRYVDGHKKETAKLCVDETKVKVQYG